MNTLIPLDRLDFIGVAGSAETLDNLADPSVTKQWVVANQTVYLLITSNGNSALVRESAITVYAFSGEVTL